MSNTDDQWSPPPASEPFPPAASEPFPPVASEPFPAAAPAPYRPPVPPPLPAPASAQPGGYGGYGPPPGPNPYGAGGYGYSQPGYSQPGYNQPGYYPSGYNPYGNQYAPNPYSQTKPVGVPGMAIASFVLGIVGVIPIIGLIPAVLAIIFGFVARSQIKVTNQPGLWLAVTGIILSGLEFLFWFVYIATAH